MAAQNPTPAIVAIGSQSLVALAPNALGQPAQAYLNLSSGTAIANGATPVTVANTNVTANSIVMFTLKTVGGTVSPNALNVLTITPGTGFTFAGTASDTSTYNYAIIG